MKTIFPVLGVMVCAYALAEALGVWIRKLENENKLPLFQGLLQIIVIGLLFCSAPIGLANLLHDSRIKKMQEQEDSDRYNALLKIQSKREDDLKNLINTLQEEKIEISFDQYDRGKSNGYRSGYIDGYKEGFNAGLELTDIPDKEKWDLRCEARDTAEFNIKFKERQNL